MNIEEIYSLNRKLNEFEQNYIQALEENQELKKRLEECVKINIADHRYASSCEDKVIVLEAQQKEFIDWLENESKELIRDAGYHQRICIEIMEKYKEIIGEKE